MRFYFKEKLSGKIGVTPEGFLLCQDVIIARTGEQIYGPEETPVTPGPEGVTRIQRDAEEVFRPETIASFNGKSVVNEHPEANVSPENWKMLTVGVVLHPRRQDDFLVADLLITDAAVMEEVQAGKRAVSCGYDAEYVEDAPGKGRQTNIVGNHVALVQEARCGSVCRIRDHQPNPSKGGDDVKKSFLEKVTTAVKDCLGLKPEDLQKVSDALNKVQDEEPTRLDKLEEETRAHDARLNAHDTMHAAHDKRHAAHDSRLDALEKEVGKPTKEPDTSKEIEGQLEEEAPPGTGDKARSAKDSAYMVDSFQETVSMAEIISPGIKVPTLDKAADPKKTLLDISHLRQDALRAAVRDTATNELVKQLRGGRSLLEADVAKLGVGQARDLFRGVAALKKQANQAQIRPGDSVAAAQIYQTTGKSLMDINKRNAEYYKN